MLDLFKGLKSLLKIKRVHIDNWIMRLNYSFTVLILLVFCIVISTREYSGDPIDCLINDLKSVPQSVINTYCWTLVTFNVPSAFNKKVGLDVPYPGIDISYKTSEFRYYNYYQWIWFVLFIQATFFYAPRWLWKNWEGGLMEYLTFNMNNRVEALKIETEYVVNYLINSKGRHNYYAYRFLFCEALTFLNIIFQFLMLNWIFDNDFLTYGYDVLTYFKFGYSQKTGSINPMTVLFPKMTKCRFFSFGPTSNLEIHDALCLLPLNVINDKIYLFIWFWYLILASLTLVAILFHFLLLLIPALRLNVFRKTLIGFDPKKDSIYLDYIAKSFPSFGDWFILHMLSENTNQIMYIEILKDLKPNQI